MPTKVRVPKPFLNELRRLARKYPAVVREFDGFAEQLKNDERPGDKVPNVGYDVYKVRLKNPSAGRGKSGGFRVIYFVQLADAVWLLTIYSKSDQEDISPEEIRRRLENILPDDNNE